jgi:two-component system alkaline phosphatase synthesis response regulator PhoP
MEATMPKKILIIDDDPFVVKVIASRLEANNYKVITSSDGKEGLEKVYKEKPDLVIVDFILPRVNGYEICSRLKEDTEFSGVPVIIITGNTNERDRRLTEDAGADAFLIKPFDREVLLSRIKELLGEE